MTQDPLRIQHVSAAHPAGGAARAGLRQHKALIESSHDSYWLQVGRDFPETENLLIWKEKRKKKKNKFRKYIFPYENLSSFRKDFKSATTFASPAIGYGKGEDFLKFPIPDIYNFHWVADFLDWPSALPSIAQRAPIVWTLHDMHPLQGVWHYAPEQHELNSVRQKWDQYTRDKKLSALQQIPENSLVFACPSNWMAEECKKSEITGRFQTVCIPNGIDTESFKPLPKKTAKAALNIPDTTRVIGFIADNLDDPRKGMAELVESITSLNTQLDFQLLSAGRSKLDTQNISHLNLGLLSSDHLLRVFYSACDVFVCPSKQDNLPNTILESMACATPVIANNVGGIPDLIIDKKNGLLTHMGDTRSLQKAIESLINGKLDAQQLGQKARQHVVDNFTEKDAASNYLSLYREVIAKFRSQKL